MSEARARPPSGERRVGLLRDKPTHGTCQVGNDVILLGFLSARHSSPAAIVNAVDTHEHDHAADTSTLPATWERRGGWSEPLRCGRTARAGSGRGRLTEHRGELGALLRRELSLAALDRADSAHAEIGLQPLDLADLGLDPGEVHGIGAKQLGQIHLGHALVHGARQEITNVEQAPARQAGEKFEDDGTGAEKVVAFLEQLKVV